MAETLEAVITEIRQIQRDAREGNKAASEAIRPRWPMIVLRSPKGWTGPKSVDGKKTEGYWRSHQGADGRHEYPGAY
jgi:xylulose-5-phosphate/fructose-6-phosphate phosphoketolase